MEAFIGMATREPMQINSRTQPVTEDNPVPLAMGWAWSGNCPKDLNNFFLLKLPV